jgi:hypothetical protein
MGLFSSFCESCGNPILADFNVGDVNDWMSLAVSIHNDEEHEGVAVTEGRYDGYGRLDEHDRCVGYGSGATVYHKACWLVAGSPRHYRGESSWVVDDEWEYDMPEPVGCVVSPH